MFSAPKILSSFQDFQSNPGVFDQNMESFLIEVDSYLEARNQIIAALSPSEKDEKLAELKRKEELLTTTHEKAQIERLELKRRLELLDATDVATVEELEKTKLELAALNNIPTPDPAMVTKVDEQRQLLKEKFVSLKRFH